MIGPFDCGGEPGATVELGRIAVEGRPVVGGMREVTVDPQPVVVLVEPGTQARPFVYQCFVRDLHRVLFDRDQSGIGEHAERGIEVFGIRRGRTQFAERRAPSGVLGALAELGEAKEDAPDQELLVGVECSVDGLGGLRDRAVCPAGGDVPVHGEGSTSAALPGLEQCVRQQWKRARLVDDIAGHELREPGLQAQTGGQCRTLDCGTKVVGFHVAEQRSAPFEELAQIGVRAAVAEEVGAKP